MEHMFGVISYLILAAFAVAVGLLFGLRASCSNSCIHQLARSECLKTLCNFWESNGFLLFGSHCQPLIFKMCKWGGTVIPTRLAGSGFRKLKCGLRRETYQAAI